MEFYSARTSLAGSIQQESLPLLDPDDLPSGWYKEGKRKWQDNAFTVTFVAFLVVTAIGGLYGATLVGLPSASQVPLGAPKIDCSGDGPPLVSMLLRPLSAVGSLPKALWGSDSEDQKMALVLGIAAALLSVTMLGSILLGILKVVLLRRAPRLVVVLSSIVLVLVPLAASVACAVFYPDPNGGVPASTQFYGFITLLFAALVWNMSMTFNTTVAVLRAASQSLSHNKSLVLLGPLVTIGGWPLYVCLGAAMVTVSHVGISRPNPEVVHVNDCGGLDEPDCCLWTAPFWVTPYLLVAGISAIWMREVLYQLEIFIIGGTIAQWYYAPLETSGGSFFRALSHGLGPSFGTICGSGVILTVTSFFRDGIHRRREMSDPEAKSVFSCIFCACCHLLQEAVKFLTRFVTIAAAATGECFGDATRRTVEMLQRHSLSVAAVDYNLTVILVASNLAGSVLWGIGSAAAVYQGWLTWGLGGYLEDSVVIIALATGLLNVFIAVTILEKMDRVVLTAVETTYLCYAADLDRGEVTKPEVHEAFAQVVRTKNPPPGSFDRLDPQTPTPTGNPVGPPLTPPNSAAPAFHLP